jgi:hypothetical protein
MDELRETPGATIAGPVRVRARSHGVRVSLAVTQSQEPSTIDIAVTQDGVAIRMLLPDGSVVTPANASEHRIE